MALREITLSCHGRDVLEQKRIADQLTSRTQHTPRTRVGRSRATPRINGSTLKGGLQSETAHDIPLVHFGSGSILQVSDRARTTNHTTARLHPGGQSLRHFAIRWLKRHATVVTLRIRAATKLERRGWSLARVPDDAHRHTL